MIERINSLVSQEIMAAMNRNAKLLSPTKIAECVAVKLDPNKVAPPEFHHLSLLKLREIASKKISNDHANVTDTQGQLFKGLQKWYPVNSDGDHMRLEHMSQEQLIYNETRLMREAKSKSKHADTLRRYRINKFPGSAKVQVI